MSLDDFERCTPEEFSAIFEAWSDREQQASRQSWEQTRMVCLCALQPHSKKALSPRDVMAFAWDDAPADHPREELTQEQLEQRFEEAKARYRLN